MTVENSTVSISPGTTEMRFSQETYFGPETDWTVDGTLEIWSEKVWIAPTAKFSGTGKIIFHNPGDSPFYEDWSAARTLIDGNDEFDYVALRNINATGGQHLTFHRNSTNNGGNSNMTFLTGSGGLVGLGEDWLCHEMDLTNTDTYILDASGFFGGPGSSYTWRKIGDSSHTGTLGTGLTLDISTFGYGTYCVTVDYGGGSTCVVSDEIFVQPVTDEPIVDDTHTQSICKRNDAIVANLIAEGQNIKWYDQATGGTALALDTELIDGATYYATQTIDDCERVHVLVILKNCSVIITNPVLINTVR